MSENILGFVIGIALVICGIYSAVRKRLSLTFYKRGFSDATYRPVFTIATINGPRAVMFGIVSIFAGTITLIPWIASFLGADVSALRGDRVLIATIIGLFIGIVGFIIACINEYLETLRRRSIAREKKLSDSPTKGMDAEDKS